LDVEEVVEEDDVAPPEPVPGLPSLPSQAGRTAAVKSTAAGIA
jgi:hypothetical protein